MQDLEYIKKAILMAQKTKGYELPNPAVGSLIVKDNKIIGQGTHLNFGKNHAEINAMEEALSNGFSLEGSTIYSTLEPCSKVGKTPSCVDRIIKAGIKRVVFGSTDPSDNNSHNKFNNKNIEVLGEVLKKDCDKLIKSFLWNIKTETPYVCAKVAMTIDGYIATKTNDSKWITSLETREYSRKKRSQYQGILVGCNTILNDDPQLNVRQKGYKDPIIIVIDPNNKIDYSNLNINKSNTKKIVFCSKEIVQDNYKTIITKQETLSTKYILESLWSIGIKSILVEGGSNTLNRFIDSGDVNEINLYIGNKILGDVNSLSAFNFKGVDKINEAQEWELEFLEKINNDIYVEYKYQTKEK